MTRHFVKVGNRRVHYTREGDGPPLLLLHESPCSAKSLAVPQRIFAERFTAIAPDTPGYGLSDPLALVQPEIADFADALRDLLDALGIEQAAVYGRHTGASIAASFAHRYPHRCAMLLTAGLPVYNTAQLESRLSEYLIPLQPSWDGTHLLWLWFRYRDQHVFWPWHDHSGARRADGDVPDLDFLQRGVLEFLEAGDFYRLAYAAAFRHGGEVLAMLPELRVPACLAAHEGDSLFRTLTLFPPDTWTAALPRGEAAAAMAERDLLSQHPATGPVPPAPRPLPLRGRTHVEFIDVGGGQVLLRSAGHADGEIPILVLHHMPGSSALYEELLLALGKEVRVIAPDLPGCGESDSGAAPCIDGWAGIAASVLDRLGLAQVHVYGHGGGASVAVALASHAPDRVASLVLDGPAAFPDAEREALARIYAPPVTPTWDGSHLIRVWHHLRDQELWRPWFDRTRAAARAGAPDIDPASLNRRARECLKHPETYEAAWRAVIGYKLLERLAALSVPVHVLASARDLFEHLAPAAAEAAGTEALSLPAAWNERARAILDLMTSRVLIS